MTVVTQNRLETSRERLSQASLAPQTTARDWVPATNPGTEPWGRHALPLFPAYAPWLLGSCFVMKKHGAFVGVGGSDGEGAPCADSWSVLGGLVASARLQSRWHQGGWCSVLGAELVPVALPASLMACPSPQLSVPTFCAEGTGSCALLLEHCGVSAVEILSIC